MKDDTCALISFFLLDIFKQMLDLKHYESYNHCLPKTLILSGKIYWDKNLTSPICWILISFMFLFLKIGNEWHCFSHCSKDATNREHVTYRIRTRDLQD